jgi:hypothetical protein
MRIGVVDEQDHGELGENKQYLYHHGPALVDPDMYAPLPGSQM